MAIMGKRIKALRTALGLTQKQLADELQVSVQSIYRYENSDASIAQEILIQLASYFDVSSDYLLGLVSFEEQKKEEEYKILPNGKYNVYYKRYLECRNRANIEANSIYYWIYITKDHYIGGHTQWVGWADDKCTREKRVLREVNSLKAFDVCTKLYGKPFIINSVEDIDIFYLVGGQALVKAEVCEKHMPEFYRDYIVKKSMY